MFGVGVVMLGELGVVYGGLEGMKGLKEVGVEFRVSNLLVKGRERYCPRPLYGETQTQL